LSLVIVPVRCHESTFGTTLVNLKTIKQYLVSKSVMKKRKHCLNNNKISTVCCVGMGMILTTADQNGTNAEMVNR
jgi:hypothetical protein